MLTTLSCIHVLMFHSHLPQDLDQQVTDYLPTVVDLFRSEEALLGSELETISAYESREGTSSVHFAAAKGGNEDLPGEQGSGRRREEGMGGEGRESRM